MSPGIGIRIGISRSGGGAYWTAAKLPSSVVSSFVVDTILGKVDWTDNSGGVAQYEVWSATNGAASVLLTTTAAGGTTYNDATAKQNASVVYSVRGKNGTAYSEFVTATALATPLCWKRNHNVLVAYTITQLTIAAGKTVTMNWGDGTSQAYTGANTNIIKNYSTTGVFNNWLSGDTDSITDFQVGNYPTTIYGNVSNWNIPSTIIKFYWYNNACIGNVFGWIIPNTLSVFIIKQMAITGDWSNKVIGANTIAYYIDHTNLSGSLPQITPHATNGIDYQLQNCKFSDSNLTTFRKAMTGLNISGQTVTFPTSNIDKLLKALADWYQNNAPTANCTFTMDGANMGIPTGGASNVDIVRLQGYYTTATKVATVVVRTS